MSRADRAPGCDKVLLVQAEFDGELDAAQAASLAAHRAECPVCAAAARQLAQSRELLGQALYEPLPDDARRRLLARLEAVRAAPPPRVRSRLRGWWMPGLGFALGAACAAALSLMVLSPGEESLTGELIADHIRALQPGHLEDVVSTNQHTVKPWFNGRLDYSPPVKDLADADFPLKGGRLDYVGGRPVAVLVYQRAKHIIDLYVWPQAKGALTPRTIGEHGYHIMHWTQNGMTFWAVSDVEANQLDDFAKAWQRSP
jgi:anti-sigma factor RsiW